ncbi:MAG TPA: hypothetical protein DCP92_11260, partial [Nitrospiraceae bacterium]|nr:hypothetical protein [Nitrospiraceae bacterium]
MPALQAATPAKDNFQPWLLNGSGPSRAGFPNGNSASALEPPKEENARSDDEGRKKAEAINTANNN